MLLRLHASDDVQAADDVSGGWFRRLSRDEEGDGHDASAAHGGSAG